MTLTTKLLNDIEQAPIVLICGPICSGKSTLSKQIAQKTGYTHIPVSKIVASIVNTHDRESLQNTADQTETICEALDIQIAASVEQFGGAIVDGIRQPDIIEYLFVLFGLNRITMIWVDPGVEERRLRWNIRAAAKDQGLSFDKIDKVDFEMGLDKIIAWLDRICVITKQ